MRRGDVGEVERRVLPHQHHVERRPAATRLPSPSVKWSPSVSRTCSGCTVANTLPSQHRHAVGRVIAEPMAARLRFQQQRERRIAADVDPLDRVHLNRDAQRHGRVRQRGLRLRRSFTRSWRGSPPPPSGRPYSVSNAAGMWRGSRPGATSTASNRMSLSPSSGCAASQARPPPQRSGAAGAAAAIRLPHRGCSRALTSTNTRSCAAARHDIDLADRAAKAPRHDAIALGDQERGGAAFRRKAGAERGDALGSRRRRIGITAAASSLPPPASASAR